MKLHYLMNPMSMATRSPDEPAAESLIPAAEPTLMAETPPAGDPPADPPAGDPPVDPPAGDPPVDPPAEGADSQAAAVVPDAYELKATTGDAIDTALLEVATPIFKELGLTNDQAQKITTLYEGSILPGVAQQVQGDTLKLLGLDGIGQWTDQTKADATIGGAKMEETLAMAAKGRDQFATPELRAFLETSRIGNHPEMVRLFAKVGQAISEGSFEQGGLGGSEGPRAAHQVFYGEEFQRKS